MWDNHSHKYKRAALSRSGRAWPLSGGLVKIVEYSVGGASSSNAIVGIADHWYLSEDGGMIDIPERCGSRPYYPIRGYGIARLVEVNEHLRDARHDVGRQTWR